MKYNFFSLSLSMAEKRHLSHFVREAEEQKKRKSGIMTLMKMRKQEQMPTTTTPPFGIQKNKGRITRISLCAQILQFLFFYSTFSFCLCVKNFFPKIFFYCHSEIYVSGTNGMILCLCECVYVFLFNFTFPLLLFGIYASFLFR